MKRIAASFSLAVLLLSLCAPASAARFPFERVRQYVPFTEDVSERDWYYENVKTVYEYGLMNGWREAYFAAGASLSYAETHTLAARLNSAWYDKQRFSYVKKSFLRERLF